MMIGARVRFWRLCDRQLSCGAGKVHINESDESINRTSGICQFDDRCVGPGQKISLLKLNYPRCVDKISGINCLDYEGSNFWGHATGRRLTDEKSRGNLDISKFQIQNVINLHD